MANLPLRNAVADQLLPFDVVGRVRSVAPAVVFVVFAAALAFVGSRHEPWFDEAQAWLIARDATPWEILTRYARYEGTPPLWHLVLWLPAHLGFPYRSLWLISGACACIGAALILWRSPFPLLMRCGILFSYFFAFQFAIVARSYALDLILLPLLAVLFERRLERPVSYCATLALLASANTHSFLVSGVLALEFAWSVWRSGKWKHRMPVVALILYAAVACGAALSTWPPSDVSFTTYTLSTTKVVRALLLMVEPFVERWDIWGTRPPEVPARTLGAILSLFLLVPSFVLFNRARLGWVILASAGAFFAFTAAKYGQAWHTGILFMVWVFGLWVSWSKLAILSARERALLMGSLTVILGVQVWYTAAAWRAEALQAYSPGEPVADAVAAYRRTHPASSVAALGVKAFVVQPWAPRNLFDNFNGGAPKPAFYDWRTSQPYLREPTLEDWTSIVESGRWDVLLLSNFEAIAPEDVVRYLAVARGAGYCARTFDADMIWKTYKRETEKVVMFTSCRI